MLCVKSSDAVRRANTAVQDSRGVFREEAVGGRSKALFKKLPGVGAGMAKRWYDLGCRCARCLAHTIAACRHRIAAT